MKFIGLDIGTSFLKGAVLDLQAMTVGPVRRVAFPEAVAGLGPAFIETDPDQLLAAARDLVAALLESDDCSGIVTCGQMGGLTLTTETGEPLSNCISWQDKRATLPLPHAHGSFLDSFERELTEDDRRRLGREVRPGLPPALLYWMARSNQLQPGVACTIPDFVVAALCRCYPAIHPTGAVGAIDLEAGDWHRSLFERLGFDTIRWPLLLDERAPVGHLKIGGRSLACYASVGDHQCALAGSSLKPGELSLNISTGSQVSQITSTWQPGPCQSRAFFDGRFLNTITNLPAGRSLNVLMRLVTELADLPSSRIPDPWQYIADAAARIPETDLRAHLAFFPTPVGDAGAIANIREDNFTVGHLFRAAFHNMAENYHASARRISHEESWRTLVFSGGVAQKLALLRAIIAEKFQRPFRVCAASEDTMQGLLALAMVASGRAPSLEQAIAFIQRKAS